MKLLWILAAFCMYFQIEAGDNSVLDLKYVALEAGKTASDIRKTVKIGKVKTLPVMDGRLNDAVWENAGEIDTFFVTNTGAKTPAGIKTRVKFFYSSNNLYIGVRCDEPSIKKVKVKCKKYGDPVWMDNCIEFWVGSFNNERLAYHILFNSAGVVQDIKEVVLVGGRIKRDYKTWHSEAAVKTFMGDTFWTAEVQIPFKNIEIANPDFVPEIRFNIGRERRSAGEVGLSSWNGNFLTPKKSFGSLKLEPPAVEIKKLDWTAFYGANQMTVQIKNNGKKEHNITIKASAKPSGSGNIVKSVILKNGDEKTIKIPYSLNKYEAPYSLEYAVLVGNEKVLSRKFTGVIPAPLNVKLDKNQFYIGKDKNLHGLINIRLDKTYLHKLNLVVKLIDPDDNIICKTRITDIKSPKLKLNCKLNYLEEEDTYKIEVSLSRKGKVLFTKTEDFEMLVPPF
jgi:Carbohydrate family 9 binding domain-like